MPLSETRDCRWQELFPNHFKQKQNILERWRDQRINENIRTRLRKWEGCKGSRTTSSPPQPYPHPLHLTYYSIYWSYMFRFGSIDSDWLSERLYKMTRGGSSRIWSPLASSVADYNGRQILGVTHSSDHIHWRGGALITRTDNGCSAGNTFQLSLFILFVYTESSWPIPWNTMLFH